MHVRAFPRIARAALGLAALGCVAVSLPGCAPSAIDAERPAFAASPAIAAAGASRARLSVAENHARRGLNLAAGAAERPAPSRGAYHQAYQRWLKGEVRELPASSETAGRAQ